jgi:hypothetical protein
LGTDPIPDGSVLYTCNVAIAGTAPSTTFPLTIGSLSGSDAAGHTLPVTGASGGVVVVSTPPTRTPIPAPRPVIAVGSATDLPNHHVTFAVTLNAMGARVAGTQLDLAFDPSTPIDADNGNPRCTVNPDIHKSASGFRFVPPGCTPGVDCAAIRAIIIAFDNLDTIPDGATLFTCSTTIERTALPRAYPLACAGALGTDPSAQEIPATCTSGSIVVQRACLGDCDGSGTVTINELLTGVSIASGDAAYAQCPAFDLDLNGSVEINELLKGVVNALNGCPIQ